MPRLALEVFAGPPAGGLLVHDAAARPCVVAADATLQAAGVRPGMPLAAARALCPQLLARRRRPARERQRLERLAAWAGQFTPQVVLVPPRGLLLEVGGSRRLFGGLEALLGKIEAGFASLGAAASCALAPTPLAATWLARADSGCRLESFAGLVRALSALPLGVLELDDKALARLEGMGLRRLGDLLRLPRDGLARRLGPELLERLDQALGRRPDPRAPFEPPPRYRARQDLALEAEVADVLLPPVRQLLEAFCGWLRARGAGVLAWRLELLHHRRPPTRILLKLSRPQSAVNELQALVEARFAALELGAPVTGIALRSLEIEALAPPPAGADLFDLRRREARDPQWLVERLRARLGRDAVRGVALREDYRPERAWAWCEPGDRGETAWLRQGLPLWLRVPAEPLEVREGGPWYRGPLRLHPERCRIESGWWDGGGVRRDYFLAEHPAGMRYWVYRTSAGDWFLHGVFG